MKKKKYNILVFQFFLSVSLRVEKYTWGGGLSEQAECVLGVGREQGPCVLTQKSPWEVSMLLILTGVRCALRGI